MTDYYAYDHGKPCQNPNCKSYGHPHPNCRCYGGMAQGGVVENFCDGMGSHESGCEYFADGGAVPAGDQPEVTLGHAAVHHGLLGLLKDVGRAKLADPDRHISVIEDAKTQHAERREPKGEEFKKTLGNKVGNHIHEKDHEAMAERLQGHPLVGSVGKQHLSAILERLSPALIEKESHPEAMRGAVDYLHSSVKGDSRLKDTMGTLIGRGKPSDEIPLDAKARSQLKEHLEAIQKDPSQVLEVGGHLGHYLPEHGSGLGALVARATDYLSSLRPKQTQANPLDEVSPPDKIAEAKYHRALDIATQPLSVLQHVKDGTLIPDDINALKTIYPGLHKSMVAEMGERLIVAKNKKEEIPYKQKQAMSLFLGQPLDATQTPQAMQAIIRSASSAQPENEHGGAAKPSAAELKQVNKVDNLYALPTERRQIDRKS